MCLDDAFILRGDVFDANEASIPSERVNIQFSSLSPSPHRFLRFFFRPPSNRYGIHLAQALTEKVIERGYSPFVVIRPQNDASRNLYTKLGYRKAFETTRVTLRPTAITNGCNGKLNGHANGHHVDNGNTNDTNGETNGDAQPKQNGNNQNKVADENGINASDELKQ